MDIPITRTKVIPPRRRSDLLSRQRLIDLLFDQLERRLILITAQAGFGKTSLLVDLIEQLSMPVCWLSLEELDQDPHRFISYFIASLAEQFPDIAKKLKATLSDQLDWERIIRTFVNHTVDLSGHFMMILDDYHFLKDVPEINDFISDLIHQSPDNFHLILSSRTLPVLPNFTFMVAKGLVEGFDFDDLAFQPEEVQQLLKQNHNLNISTGVAEELVSQSNGWITGLLLSTQTIGQALLNQIRIVRRANVNVYDYLVQQVLEQQTPEVQEFLLRTSLLEEFNAEMCHAILGTPERATCQALITAIEQNNLFVSSLGEDGSWLRYHSLFRDFLQSLFIRHHPRETDQIRLRLADWYTEHSQWEKAHRIYQQLQNYQADASLLEQAGSALIKNGRAQTLTTWIDELPTYLRTSRPALLSLRATTLGMFGKMSQCLFLFDEAVKLCRANQAQALLARTLVRRATAYDLVANYQAAQTDVEEALVISEAVGLQQVYAEALRLKGMNLYRQGETQDAIEWLTHSLTMYELLGEEQNVAILNIEIGMIEIYVGDYIKALEHNTRALSYWERVENPERLANLLNNQGVLHHLCGDYEKAVITWERALAQAKQSSNARVEAYILSSFGDLYVELEAYAQAQLAYQKSRTQAQRHDERFLLFYLLLAEANLSMKQGLLSQAGYLLGEATELAKVSNSPLEHGFLSLEKGRLALCQERYSEAIPLLEMATHHLQRAQQQPKAACAHLHLAVAYYYAGHEDDAFGHLERAFQLAARLESKHTLLIAGGELVDKLPAFKTPPVQRLLTQVEEFHNSLPSLRRNLRRHTRFIPLDPPRLIIRALGESRAMVNGSEVHWRWAKGRDLLFCLLLYPRGLTKEEIGEFLWPGSTAKGLKINFKQAMKFLRQAIGSESVRYQGRRYLFNRSIDYEYDVDSFLAQLEQAGKQQPTPEQIEAYEGAIQHYGGFFLRAVEDDWVLAERTRLQQLYLEAMVRLAELYLKQNDLQMALQRCEEAFLAEPGLEEAHRLAMRIHAIHGNRVGVANQFERCKKALAELDVAPSQKTKALYKRLIK